METTTNNIVKGDIFIVPNHAETPQNSATPEIWNMWVENRKLPLNYLGLKPEDVMIQVWVTNEEVDNFACHFDNYAEKYLGVGPEVRKTSEAAYWNVKRQFQFPSHFPLSALKGLKEGDTLKLRRHDGRIFELTAAQNKHRYAQYGPFEQALHQVAAGWMEI